MLSMHWNDNLIADSTRHGRLWSGLNPTKLETNGMRMLRKSISKFINEVFIPNWVQVLSNTLMGRQWRHTNSRIG
jgi:hypothetical protein